MRSRMKEYVILWLLFAIIGTALELGYGAFWSAVGTTPWTYPYSALHHTSWAVFPGWGFGGLVCASVYRAFVGRNPRLLLTAIVPLVLSAAWIVIYSLI